MVLKTFPVDDAITEEEEGSWSVHRLRVNRDGGPSRIREEHLRYWLHAVTRKELPELIYWNKVVWMIQIILCEGRLT